MSNGADLKGRIDLDVSGATNALKAAQKAFRDLSDASTANGKQMTQSQRAAARAVITDYDKLRKAQSKVVDSAIEMERKWTLAEQKGRSDRANNAKKTAASVGLTNAATEYTQAKTGGLATMVPLQADNLLAKTAKIDTASNNSVELKNSRLLTEEQRRQMALRDESARRLESNARMELNLRKQIWREQKAINAAQDAGTMGLSGMRYAVYDVASSFRQFGIGAVAASTAVFGIGIAWEKSFADVVRTTGVSANNVEYLRAQFTDLVQTLPISWEKLTEIGTLAGQLGVAKSHVADFTKTTAMFSATTDVSVDAAATAFGRLDSIIPTVKGNYEGLANSILKVGVNSVATESQIIKISTQIAAIAAPAGFSYQQIVGLSGALASVAVPPELARGVITRTFSTIGTAVNNGGLMLEKFGTVAGMSGKQFGDAWKGDAAGTFQTFVGRLAASGAQADGVLKELGITSVRDKPILMRLGGAADSTGARFDVLTGKGGLLNQTMGDASNATGELQKQYQIISGTAGAKMQVLFQNIQAALAKIGDTKLGTLGNIFDDLTTSLRRFTEGLDDNVRLFDMWDLDTTNGELLGTVVAIGAVIGVAALLIAGIGQVIGGGLAMGAVWTKVSAHFAANAVAATANTAAISTLSAATAQNAAVTTAATAATSGAAAATGRHAAAATVATVATSGAAAATGRWSRTLSNVGGLLAKVGPAMGMMALAAGVIAVVNHDAAMAKLGTTTDGVTNAFLTASKGADVLKRIQINTGDAWGQEKLTPFVKDLGDFRKGLDNVNGSGFWSDFGHKTADVFNGLADTTQGFNNFTNGLGKIDEGYAAMVASGNGDKAAQSMSEMINKSKLTDQQLDTLIGKMPEFAAGLRNNLNGREMQDTKQNLRDVARGDLPELQDAMVATAGIMDGVVSESFDGISEDALQFMTDIGASIASTVDMGTAYSDAIESANAKAKVAWVAGGNDVSEFKEVATASLDDYMAVVDQRIQAGADKVKNLAIISLKGGADMASAAAKMPDEVIAQVAAAAEGGTAEFTRWMDQVNAISAEAMSLASANVANSTPAMMQTFADLGGGGMQEFIAAISKGDRSVTQILDDLRAAQAAVPVVIPITAETELAKRQARQAQDEINRMTATILVNVDVQRRAAIDAVAGLTGASGRPVNVGEFSTGGYTGAGDMNQPAGTVHKGEFVMTKKATTNLGPAFLYNLMHSASKGYATGGEVAGSSNSYVQSFGGSNSRANRASASQSRIVELSPLDRALLRANGNIGLSIDGREIAQATNTASLVSTKRGSN